MNSNGRAIFWILCVVVAVLVLWSLSIPAVTVGFDHSRHARALSNINQLSRAVKEFVADQKHKNPGHTQYPTELHQLVTDGHLTEQDFSKLTKNIEISYFPPTTESPSPNHMLIVAHIPKYIIYAPIDGKLVLRKIP
jgi:hypothetical protein